MILGIDFSLTSCGYIVAEGNEVIAHGTINTRKQYSCLYLDTVIRAQTLAAQLCDVYKSYDYQPTIHIESLSMGSSGSATRTLPLALGIVLQGLYLSPNNPFVFVPPTTLKKFATGKGNATKDMMVDAVLEHNAEFYDYLMTIPKSKGRYDLTDAYWLTQYK